MHTFLLIINFENNELLRFRFLKNRTFSKNLFSYKNLILCKYQKYLILSTIKMYESYLFLLYFQFMK